MPTSRRLITSVARIGSWRQIAARYFSAASPDNLELREPVIGAVYYNICWWR